MTSPVIVDISHWNAEPDWPALKAGGIVGVILKCTESDDYVDPTFAARYQEAIDAGVPVASYHFLRPGSMQAQMDHYLNTLQPRDGERLCLDHEDDGVSLADLEDAVSYLLTDSRNLQIAIYSGWLIKEQLAEGYSEQLAANTSLWLAQYSSTPDWPTATWETWSLWQYTDQAIVDGIASEVDGNKFNGSADAAVKWIGPPAEPAPPTVEVDMIVDLKIREGATYAVYVNGRLIDERVPEE